MWSRVRKNLLQMPLDSQEKDFTQIEDNMFLGNIDFAHNHYSMKKYNISLVVAVYPKDMINLLVQMIPSDCRFHLIDAKDSPNEDLISHFDTCYDLIHEELELNDGKVLIFCGAGLSRSVTIMTAYIMRRYKICCEEAVERIRLLRPKINPNPGFWAQLKLYDEMNFVLDKTNREYRIFALIMLKKKIWSDKYWADSRVATLNRQFCEPMRSYMSKLSLNEKSRFNYQCINCHRLLFDEINVLSLIVNSDQIQDLNVCDKLFIEPVKWLTPLLCCSKRDQIDCPECGHSLGQFKWKSYKCECLLHKQLRDSKIIKIFKSSVIRCSD